LLRRAVFLDRDGTMIRDVGYLSRVDQMEWLPGAIDAVRRINQAGFILCVVTNQGGIGLGVADEATVHLVHQTMDRDLSARGAVVDGWYFCPHHPRAVSPALRVACECRKPRPGLVLAAQRVHGIDLAASFVVGDKAIDLGLASAVGARGVLVRTGYGEQEWTGRRGHVPEAAHVASDLLEATAWICRQPPLG
jgi:D-glycero-D-manno-heptose 1,7-bisphosphate phosphatase